MAEDSYIEWTDHTFNPWIGCTKVSAGCDHCYAETWDARGLSGGARRWGPHAPRTRTNVANWRKPLAWNKAAQAAGKRARVFCASLADVFDNHASILPEWRADLWALIAATPPQHGAQRSASSRNASTGSTAFWKGPTMADKLPQTVYVQRGPNDGDLQVHDHDGFGGEEYVHKDVLVAMRDERDAALECVTLEATARGKAESERDDYKAAYEDTKRLARNIDVALHGEEGAAIQASLCDLVGPAEIIRAESDALRARVAELSALLDRAVNGIWLGSDTERPVPPYHRRAGNE